MHQWKIDCSNSTIFLPKSCFIQSIWANLTIKCTCGLSWLFKKYVIHSASKNTISFLFLMCTTMLLDLKLIKFDYEPSKWQVIGQTLFQSQLQIIVRFIFYCIMIKLQKPWCACFWSDQKPLFSKSSNQCHHYFVCCTYIGMHVHS